MTKGKFIPNPPKKKRLSKDLSEVVTYPDGSRYIWHKGCRRKATPRPTLMDTIPVGMTQIDIALAKARENMKPLVDKP